MNMPHENGLVDTELAQRRWGFPFHFPAAVATRKPAIVGMIARRAQNDLFCGISFAVDTDPTPSVSRSDRDGKEKHLWITRYRYDLCVLE